MAFHGLLLIDKPTGLTSHDVVAKVRRIMGTKSVGHSGTLDPLASGLMVLLIGEATKLSQYILEQNKAYKVKAKLGLTTDTLDITGQALKTEVVKVSLVQIRNAAMSLSGEMQLPIPLFSAAKVDGKKLYEYARQGQEIEPPLKVMNFFDLEFHSQGPDWVEMSMHCTKGSFIRSWVHLLGQKLGCGAAMSELRRTESQPYKLDQALTFEELENQMRDLPRDQQPQGRGFVPMLATLPQAKLIRVKGQDRVMISNGLISHDLRTLLIGSFQPGRDDVIKILAQETGELLALIGIEPKKGFVFRRVFRYEEST